MPTNGCKHGNAYDSWVEAMTDKAGVEIMLKGQTNNYGDRVTLNIGGKTITVKICRHCWRWY